jgi:hypothetical protein
MSLSPVEWLERMNELIKLGYQSSSLPLSNRQTTILDWTRWEHKPSECSVKFFEVSKIGKKRFENGMKVSQNMVLMKKLRKFWTWNFHEVDGKIIIISTQEMS